MPVSDPSLVKIKLFLKAHENLCGAIIIVLLLFFFFQQSNYLRHLLKIISTDYGHNFEFQNVICY